MMGYETWYTSYKSVSSYEMGILILPSLRILSKLWKGIVHKMLVVLNSAGFLWLVDIVCIQLEYIVMDKYSQTYMLTGTDISNGFGQTVI